MRTSLRRRVLGTMALLVSAWIGAAIWAGPASADDCTTLVENIGDLADEYKMQDCLRTGSNWGRVIGTVVGGAGIAIAVVGIRPSRPPVPTPPTEAGTSVASGTPPCEEMAIRGRRVAQLLAARRKLEAEIVAEWKVRAQGARVLTDAFRNLKEIHWKIAQARAAGVVFNISFLGMWFCALGPAFKAAGAAFSAGWAALLARLGIGAGTAAVASTQAAAAAGTGLSEGWAAAGAGLVTMSTQIIWDRIPAKVPGPKPTADPLAEEIMTGLVDMVRPVFQQYVQAAKTYNQAFAQWGTDRQQDLDRISQEIQSEVDRLNAAARNCGFAKVPDFSSATTPPVTLHVLQVPEELGDMWWFGSSL